MDYHGAPYRSRRVDPTTRDLYDTVGRNIMACRQMRGLSSGDLAASALIPEGVLLGYETGKQRVPTGDLVKIIEVCDVPVSRMFTRIDMPSQRHAEGTAANPGQKPWRDAH